MSAVDVARSVASQRAGVVAGHGSLVGRTGPRAGRPAVRCRAEQLPACGDRLDEASTAAETMRRAGEFFARPRAITSCSSASPPTPTLPLPRSPPGTPRRGPSGRWPLQGRPSPGARSRQSTFAPCRRPSTCSTTGAVVAEANDDPGERERAGLLFHDRTILAPHIEAFVAYLDGAPVLVRDDARQPRRGRGLLRRDGRARPPSRPRRCAHAHGRTRRVRARRPRSVARRLGDGRRPLPAHRVLRPRHERSSSTNRPSPSPRAEVPSMLSSAASGRQVRSRRAGPGGCSGGWIRR